MPTVYTQEFKQRALRLMEDHLHHTQCSQWSAAQAVGTKLGISPHTMRGWLKQARRDAGTEPGATTDELEELRRLRRENRELRRAKKLPPRFLQPSQAAAYRNDRLHRYVP